MLEVIHSPKLEDLADQLADELRAQRLRQLDKLLQPIVVVVGHLGIARWLEQRIALRFGIFANVHFVLTSEWLNAEMAHFGVLGKEHAERFSVSTMTWALYALLEAPERFGLLSDKALLERERFQLAAKLAHLFSEYLIYRREWLLDFEQAARTSHPTLVNNRAEPKDWQARLWCALSARLKGGHRAAKFYALLNAIKNQPSAARIDTPTYFFGLNHLPPDVLTLLERLSESASVQIYFPNPCVEYWADVVRERFLVQRRLGGDLLQTGREDPGGFDHFDVGHPLLASLGGHGQMYFAELSHATADFIEVEEVEQAETLTPTLLAALQYGITHLQPDFAPANLRLDASIQVFGAQSLVDELARVKAIILAALLAEPNLQLEDIAIMTPTLSRYAPLLPAVFGTELCASPPIAPAGKKDPAAWHPGPRAQSALRYSVLDLTQASISPLLQQLLQAPELRWEPAQLLAVLSLAELTQHFGLDASDLSQASHVLQRAHIAFGFNDAHRRQLIAATSTSTSTAEADTLPSASLHTWEAGLERLLFGYLHGNQDELDQAPLHQLPLDQAPLDPLDAPEPLWPVPDISVRHAPILSALLQLIRGLRVFNFGTQRSRTMPQWTRWLERQIFSFTGAAAPDLVRAMLLQLELDAANAELEEDVSFVALREACLSAMAQASGRSTPALGAICVCGLVPMRAMPFKVVCILGLNEAEFPKPELPDSLNLMRASGARRPGDRSRAQEDRYLFLEAIMATRSQLVLSYQGFSSDGSVRQPCSVLAELLMQLERQFGARLSGKPWLAAAPPSGNASLSKAVTAPSAPQADLPADLPADVPTDLPTVSSATPRTSPEVSQVLNVNAFFRFWQQPLRIYVQQHLRVAPQQTDADQTHAARHLEPLSLAPPPIERVEARLLAHALEAGRFPASAPPWLARSGLLPSGPLGLQSYANIEETCRAAWSAINARFPEFLGALKQAVRVDLNLGSTRLVGYIPGVYSSQRACVCVSSKALHGLQRFQLLLRVLLLRASEADRESGNKSDTDSSAPPWRALHLGPKAAELVIYASPSEARDYLAHLITLRSDYLLTATDSPAAAAAAPPWFWPKLSYTAFSAKGSAHEAVMKVIEAGNEYELANSGLKFWLPNADFFEAGSAEFAQFLELAQRLFAPLTPSKQMLSKQAKKPANNKLPSILPSSPSPRAFAVTEVTKLVLPPNLSQSNSVPPNSVPPNSPPPTANLVPPNSPPLAQAKTLDLEHFGHDDAADFDHEY